MANWHNLINRPHTLTMKKYLSQILKERYAPHDELIERITTALVTKGDLEAFSKFVVAIYETAYEQCVQDHVKVLQQQGLKAAIKSGRVVTDVHAIFQEKSG